MTMPACHMYRIAIGIAICLAVGIIAHAEPPSIPKAAPTPEKARIDCFGDPLPSGASARLGRKMFLHDRIITGVAFSPDCKTIASASQDGTVRLWQIATGKEICLTHEPGELWGVAYSPDGKTVAS